MRLIEEMITRFFLLQINQIREKIKRIAKEENIPICEIGLINESDEK